MSSEEEKSLPPYPAALLEWTEEQDQNLRFRGDKTDIPRRMANKLYSVWMLWADLRNNEKLINHVNKESSPDDFFMKQLMVLTIDRIAKILSDTDLTEELIKTNEEKTSCVIV